VDDGQDASKSGVRSAAASGGSQRDLPTRRTPPPTASQRGVPQNHRRARREIPRQLGEYPLDAELPHRYFSAFRHASDGLRTRGGLIGGFLERTDTHPDGSV